KFLIITHPNFINGANNIASYKNSKNLPSRVFSINDLYDQFSYGIHHPLAIRNLIRYYLATANTKPEYLFLIGKGYESSKYKLNEDLIPTMGFPASDILFSANILDNTIAPALATGRLPV